MAVIPIVPNAAMSNDIVQEFKMGNDAAYKITSAPITQKIREKYYVFLYDQICAKETPLCYGDLLSAHEQPFMVRYAYGDRPRFLWVIAQATSLDPKLNKYADSNGIISLLIDHKNILIINLMNPFKSVDPATVAETPTLFETVLYGQLMIDRSTPGETKWHFLIHDILLNTGMYTFSKKKWGARTPSTKTAIWRMALLKKWYFDFIQIPMWSKIKLSEYFDYSRIQEMCAPENRPHDAVGITFVPTINSRYCSHTYLFNGKLDNMPLNFVPQPRPCPSTTTKQFRLKRIDDQMEFKYILQELEGSAAPAQVAYIKDRNHAELLRCCENKVINCVYNDDRQKWMPVFT